MIRQDKHLKFYSLAWKIISCVFLLGLQVATTTVTLKVMMIIRGARQWWLTHARHAWAKTSGGTAPCRCCCAVVVGVVVEVVGGVEVLEEAAEVVSSK